MAESNQDNFSEHIALKEKESNSILRKRPQHYDVSDLLRHKANSWNKIARELEVEFHYREEIERSIRFSQNEQKLESVLYHWIESDRNATWETLIDALKKLKYMDAVRTVQEFLAKPKTVQEYINSEDGNFYVNSVDLEKDTMSKEPPKAIDVFRLVKPRSASWSMIARELGVELLYRQELEDSKQIDYEDKLERILIRWLESESSAPTWETIIDVLRKLRFTDVVRDVQQFIGVPADPPNTGNSLEDIEEDLVSKEAVELKKTKIMNRMSEPDFKKAQGIIFVIGIYGADGTAKDVENIERRFKKLKFCIYTERDPTAAEIIILIKAAAKCDYPYRYRYVAFYYAGHGGSDEFGELFITPQQAVNSNPGVEVLYIEKYIVEPLNCLKDRDLTRLFFFDCCQSQGKATHTMYSPRDSGQVVKKTKQHPGVLIAYATSDGQKSFGDQTNGGIWTYHLCKNLKKDLPLVTILAETYDEIVKKRESFQEPTTVTRIGALQLAQPEQKTCLLL